jgi:mannose-1-phosphate guanylyltransferase
VKTGAILLVGGMGSRLMPLTKSTPKPMLSVAGVPFTEHQIRKAADAGISEIVLATSYKSELFEPYFDDGDKFGIKIKYAVEKTALGTGGGIKNASFLLENCDEIVIFNGDVLSGHSLKNQLDFHRKNKAEVTLYLTEVKDARAYGCVELSADKQVESFNEKMENPKSNLINAGCYVFNPKIIEQIAADKVVSIERETFPALLASGIKVVGYVDNSYWLDIGTPAALVKASADLILGKISSSATPSHSADCLIFDSATIGSGSNINNGSVIESRVIVESNCQISGSIIGTGAKIGSNCQIVDSIIAPGAQIQAGMVILSNYLGF